MQRLTLDTVRVCVALKPTVCMAETISIMCSRITELRKVSPASPFIFIPRFLIEKFPFCSFMCMARQLSFIVTGTLRRQAFFFFFPYTPVEYQIFTGASSVFSLPRALMNISQTPNGKTEMERTTSFFHTFSAKEKVKKKKK